MESDQFEFVLSDPVASRDMPPFLSLVLYTCFVVVKFICKYLAATIVF
jgi:hypothetical protein